MLGFLGQVSQLLILFSEVLETPVKLFICRVYEFIWILTFWEPGFNFIKSELVWPAAIAFWATITGIKHMKYITLL